MKPPISNIQLHTDSKTPLYLQLATAIGSCIQNGDLMPDAKLPAIRKMADYFGVNSVTIVTAYKHLEQKQMVYSRVGSGTFVCPVPMEEVPEFVHKGNQFFQAHRLHMENAIDFANTSLPKELFPVEAFKTAFNQVLDVEGGGAFRYIEPMGYLPLRGQLATFLSQYGMQATAENLQIISGAQHGLDLISKAMLGFGDVVFVESPTFYGATGAFLSRGAKIIEIPMESDGMKMELLESYLKIYQPKFIYMMSYFQTPTGISYSMEKKRKLLELAETYNTYIVEEDDYYDFHYGRDRILPLKALDRHNRVIYIKSFSKILMTGLRMGLMVMPKPVQLRVSEINQTTDIATSGFIQKAMELYLKDNDLTKYAEQMRRVGSEKYRKTLFFAKKYLSEYMTYELPNGGVTLWMELPEGVLAQDFCNRMLERGVILIAGSQYELVEKEKEYIRLSFCNVNDDALQVGMKRMAEELRASESHQ
ncbi:PLP-dependent aminotransferase family protein [Chakrabartyella piscis]|uniref:MocR-like pyridoxine biosynthesis transcription factor PdxR n=1 Tax=Chakrabartyella piscis TaxID=2918914 RepID=UPI002958521E|nr:PLP-dependent aminotransferase family protein [Chakrabartyella piscis]